jgi:hypothetical protein
LTRNCKACDVEQIAAGTWQPLQSWKAIQKAPNDTRKKLKKRNGCGDNSGAFQTLGINMALTDEEVWAAVHCDIMPSGLPRMTMAILIDETEIVYWDSETGLVESSLTINENGWRRF